LIRSYFFQPIALSFPSVVPSRLLKTHPPSLPLSVPPSLSPSLLPSLPLFLRLVSQKLQPFLESMRIAS
jgi:hypothetical protein